MGNKIQAVGFIGILIAGSSLDSEGWIWGLVFLAISASIMEIVSEDNRYIHFIPKGSTSVAGVMIYDKVDEEFVNSVKKKKKKRS